MFKKNLKKVLLTQVYLFLSALIIFLTYRQWKAEKEFSKGLALAQANHHTRSGYHYKQANLYAPWEKRYVTYIGIYYETLARSSRHSILKKDLLKKAIFFYQKSLKTVSNDIWPQSGLVRSYMLLKDLEPNNHTYKTKLQEHKTLASKLCPSRKFY